MKKVSVVMCTYNGADYLREQLDSIVEQTYPIHELIIQDDVSTDQTVDILKEYEKRYDYIHVYFNKEQKGINGNFFSAMNRATGDYIAISDQDDIWESDKIAYQMNTIGHEWVSCGFSNVFSEDHSTFFDNRLPNPSVERLLYVNTLAAGHTILMKKEMLQFIPVQDTIMYDNIILIVAAANNKISFVDKILVNHREHVKSATYIAPVMARGRNHKSIKNIFTSVLRTFKLHMELKNYIREYFVKVYTILKSVPVWEGNGDALKIAKYQSQKGFTAYVKLTLYCIKNRQKLFYAREKDGLLTFLRAIYFPISSSDYFRYKSVSHK